MTEPARGRTGCAFRLAASVAGLTNVRAFVCANWSARCEPCASLPGISARCGLLSPSQLASKIWLTPGIIGIGRRAAAHLAVGDQKHPKLPGVPRDPVPRGEWL